MCCIQIRGEILVKNVLGCSELNKLGIRKMSISYISKCGIYLENNLPGYVDCETDEQILSRALNLCGYLVGADRQIDIQNITIMEEDYNRIYTEEIAREIENLVRSFFTRRLYENNKKIIKMKHVYVG